MQKHNILGIGLLWFSAIVFIVYGLFGFFNPNIPADFGGLQMINGNGYAEIGAMYGGPVSYTHLTLPTNREV